MSLQLRPACLDCRDRHLRCDRQTPICSNCSKARPPRKCVWEHLKIRHSTYSAKVRKQSKSRKKKIKEDENSSGPGSKAAESQDRTEDTSSQQQETSAATPHAYESLNSWTPQNHTSPAQVPLGQAHSNTYSTPGGDRDLSNWGGSAGTPQNSQGPGLVGGGTSISSSPQVSAFSYAHASRSGRVVTDDVERSVFDFYIRHAGPWLDIVSSRLHFGQTITRMALSEPVLYAACLAYASHVLYLNSALDSAVHDEFQDRAIGILIPLLSPKTAPAKDEALLATVVILRMSEQFSEIGDDEFHHLRGSNSVFSAAQKTWSATALDVCGASFWVWVREAIRISFLNEEPCQLDLSIFDPEFSMENEAEEGWTNYVSYLMAKMCSACWGSQDPDARQAMRDEICGDLERWRSTLPNAFQPWHFSRRDFEPFPVVKFLSTWHEIAWQFYYTIQVMAAVYDTRGGERTSVLDMHTFMEEKIMSPAKMATSVCLSSENVGCNINGAHLVAWCGRFFTGKEEQRLLAKFLEDFTSSTSWPNRTCYDRLRQIWNGSRKAWVERDGVD